MMTRMRLYAIVLVLATMTAMAQAQVQPSARPIDGLAHRILGDRDTLFKFVCQPDTVDYFVIERLNGDTGGIPKRY
ncbi:MAG: hypothetical protein K6C07_00655, partial [Bacteroidales bacterium]|nr:hypothetical protein [Bacteroidales bacterium]